MQKKVAHDFRHDTRICTPTCAAKIGSKVQASYERVLGVNDEENLSNIRGALQEQTKTLCGAGHDKIDLVGLSCSAVKSTVTF